MSGYPEDLKYTKDHEWVRMEGNIATVGISKYAVDQLGDVTYVGLPREGDDVSRGEAFGTVESVKAQSDIYCPVSGTIVKVNEELEDNPEFVNESPYDKGWMIQVEVSDMSELDDLMPPDLYTKYVADQE